MSPIEPIAPVGRLQSAHKDARLCYDLQEERRKKTDCSVNRGWQNWHH